MTVDQNILFDENPSYIKGRRRKSRRPSKTGGNRDKRYGNGQRNNMAFENPSVIYNPDPARNTRKSTQSRQYT